MLTMLEDVVLLAVDEKTGRLRSTREFGTAYALVGALFFDLALALHDGDSQREATALDRLKEFGFDIAIAPSMRKGGTQ